jgi:nucleoid DNA-binding protein
MTNVKADQISKQLPDFYSPMPQEEVVSRLLSELKAVGWLEGKEAKAIHATDVWVGKVGNATAYWVPQADEIDREKFSEMLSKDNGVVFGGILGDDLFEFENGLPFVTLEHDGNGTLGEYDLFDLLNPGSLDPTEAQEIKDGASKTFGPKLINALQALKTEFSNEKMIRTYFQQRFGLKGESFTVQKVASLYYPYASTASSFPAVDEAMQIAVGLLAEKKGVILPGLGEFKKHETKITFSPDENFLDWLEATEGEIEEVTTWPEVLGKSKKTLDAAKLREQFNRWISALRKPNLSLLADDFFQMSVRTVPAFSGKNPITGKQFTIPAKRTPLIYFR